MSIFYMKRPIVFILLACTLLYMLTGCKENARNSSGETATHSNATYSNASSAQFPDIGLPEESVEENGSYMAQTNFVEKNFPRTVRINIFLLKAVSYITAENWNFMSNLPFTVIAAM